MSIFKRVLNKKTSPLDLLYKNFNNRLASSGTPFVNTAGTFSFENYDSEEVAAVEDEMQELDNNLSKAATTTREQLLADGVSEEEVDEEVSSFTPQQRDAAMLGALAVANRTQVLEAQRKNAERALAAGSIPATVNGSDIDVGRTVSTEAYDESENKNAMSVTYFYNLYAARQDAFGEALFPTVVMTPDQADLEVAIELISVENEYRHKKDGTYDMMFNRKNLIRGLVDDSILENATNRLYPVYRSTDTKNIANFVDQADVPPRTIKIENGEEITTSPLAVTGRRFNLLGLSSPDYLIESGAFDQTDQIGHFIQVENVYIKLANGDVIKFANVQNQPGATFNYAVQGPHRQMNLHFDNPHYVIDKDTTKVDGTPLTGAIATNDVTVRVGFMLTGSVNLNDGGAAFSGGVVSITDVHNASKEQLAESDSTYTAVEADLRDAKVIGIDLIAYRINSNRRERGQLLAANSVVQRYAVPVLAPITWNNSHQTPEDGDAVKIESLIKTTYIRCSNSAVSKLFEAEAILSTLPKNLSSDVLNKVDGNQMLGMSRYLVTPWYEHVELDVLKEVNSLKSADRIQDVQAVLVNTIRDMVFRAYVESSYRAASDMVFGPNSGKPTVVIATSAYISNYLMLHGEPRTLGENFDVEIVHTLNRRMDNKIRIVFGKMSKVANDLENPLHFGNMLWRPEIVSNLPLSRPNNTHSRELTVQPSFCHIVHTPIMMSIDLVNLDKAVAKMLPVFTHEVAATTAAPATAGAGTP